MKVTIFMLIILSIVTVLITGFWEGVSNFVFPNLTWGLYNKDFFENLLVEMHGGIIDLLIVGVILYGFEIRRAKSDSIKEAKNNLADLRYYSGSDASFKFYRALRLLASLKVHNVEMPNGSLNDLKIKSLSLSKSNLAATDFSRSTLDSVSLQNCDLQAAQFFDSKLRHCIFKNLNLKRSKFIKADLRGMSFESCIIEGAVFKDSNLQSAIFKGVDCRGVSFKGCNLRGASFRGAQNLTRNMVEEAEDYRFVKYPERADD
nr:pentapeptide repeats family protein [Psychrobacter sp.]